ncbi:bifunctional phosphopantothenoylcysteine decarboxylase/phosphopantothenate--cysteine ligase CoaBC [Flammeovirgaceae bacterium SG7u.111]|nr:bifunctional phosphopantothenoylcysteine decarboxylase/phosphopantothenate--cysteine ligase CoaBC [Flammeovirgaceae bacterium SG7u.132]WPO36320.1 bifunctional phosphopantothenoylcysteine decarboxylase/phosphopantothenate--cysteine ligase CoaBC [Flammeovirgaceae bacterium SG7u.111]
MLKNKKILIGVTGSIAAYKAALLIRLLKKQGAEVKVIMTASASDFISPLTLATLSENPVYTVFTKEEDGTWHSHVELGLWADIFVVAPASANTMAKMANGLCDNLLSAVYLSARCPVFVAPAMDLDMFVHPSTQQNLKTLKGFGHEIIDAETGELASGLVGKGRMAEPENILEIILKFFEEDKPLKGKKVMITAGPTYEYIDPVRFMGNGSSGKMGYAIAEKMANLGAEVTIVSGPVSGIDVKSDIEIKKVVSAEDMFTASLDIFPQVNVAIFAAAVADYTPVEKSPTKIKKNDSEMNVVLKKTKDIAKELGKIKKEGQISVGFALETDNELENAKNKLATKNFDFIVLNSLQDKGAGFGHDTNRITIVETEREVAFDLKSKAEVAADIANHIVNLIGLKNK